MNVHVLQDILAVAREQVLDRGDRLTQAQVLEVLRLPDDRLGELLALAHEVRLKWCGPEVEVEGIVSLKTARSYFPQVVTTHSWEERWDTCLMVRESGMELCCGGLVGMGKPWRSAPSLPGSSAPSNRTRCR